MSTGLFLPLRDKTFIIAFISGSLPITGSNLPASASAVRSLQYKLSALGISLRLKASCLESISSLLIEVNCSEFEFLEVGFAEI